MKSASLPAVRVSPEIRQAAEAVLQEDETLSGFVEEAVRRSIALRESQREFIARGLAVADSARRTGSHISASDVLGKLDERLEVARRKASTGK